MTKISAPGADDDDKQKAYHQAYRLKHKDRMKAYRQAYYLKHKDSIKAATRAYAEKNKEKLKEAAKLYFAKHREEIRLKAHVAYMKSRESRLAYARKKWREDPEHRKRSSESHKRRNTPEYRARNRAKHRANAAKWRAANLLHARAKEAERARRRHARADVKAWYKEYSRRPEVRERANAQRRNMSPEKRKQHYARNRAWLKANPDRVSKYKDYMKEYHRAYGKLPHVREKARLLNRSRTKEERERDYKAWREWLKRDPARYARYKEKSRIKGKSYRHYHRFMMFMRFVNKDKKKE